MMPRKYIRQAVKKDLPAKNEEERETVIILASSPTVHFYFIIDQ